MCSSHVRFTTSALVATIGVLAIARGAIATLPESRTTTDDATALSVLQGTWIVRAYPSGQPLGLVHVDVKDQQPRAALLAVGQPNFYRLKGSGIEGFRFDGESVRFTLRLVQEGNPSAKLFPVVAYLPDREGLPKVLPGSVEVSGFRYPVELERSDQKELTPTEAEALAPGNAELRQFNQAESVEKRKQILQGILEKYPDRPIAYTAANALMDVLAGNKAPDVEVRSTADRSIRLAAPYGREMELFAVHRVAWRFVDTEGLAGVAADYARRAEAMLQPSDPIAVRASILRTLASALLRAGKGDEARGVVDRVAKHDEVLDQEYVRTAPALKAEPFAGRWGEGARTVLMELFTGARCGPCVHADAAFDALIGTYHPQDVILIQYHVHIPGFDALANEGSVARGRYYRALYAPFACVDGRDLRLMALGASTAEAGYRAVRAVIEERMETGPGAAIGLEAGRDGDKVVIRAKVTGLKTAGDSIRLRFVLVEREVRYEGSNGVRLNRHVARALPGGPRGFPLDADSVEHAVTVDLGELLGGLNRYLDGFSDQRHYPDNYRPVDFGPLSVVAVIQDDASKEVLQAAQAEIPPVR